MSKSIGISAIFRRDQLAGGVFSVFDNLARGIDELKRDLVFPLDPFTTVYYGAGDPPRKYQRLNWVRVSDRFGRFAAETWLGIGNASTQDAMLFLNYFTPPLVRAKKTVTIVHDLQYLHMPELYTLQKRIWLRCCHAMTLRTCDSIIAISNVVRSDMLRAFGQCWEDKIHVIWNPVCIERFAGAGIYDVTGGRPYVLCVAVDRPQKNLYRLIKAFHLLRKSFPEHCLVLAGQLRSLRKSPREQSRSVGRTMPATVDLVTDMGLTEHVRVTGFVNDSQLGALYRGATMFILPSEFEGFGMPAVESLALGKPTLVSGLPVLREVTLNSAHYLEDPTNIDAMADSIGNILRNPNTYQPNQDLVDRIRKCFSPRTIAEQYIRLLCQ